MSPEKAEHFLAKEPIEAFTKWLAYQDRSPRTVEGHLHGLKRYGEFLESTGSDLETATAETITAYQAWLLDYVCSSGSRLNVNSQLTLLSTLKVFYHFMHSTGRVLNDPAAEMTLPRRRESLPSSMLDPKEVRRLFKQPDLNTVSGFRDRTMLELLYSCGLRISELRQLKEEDFDAFNGSLLVREGKGGKDRIVPVGETARRYLGDYIAQVRPLLLKEDSEILFLNRFGRVFGVSGLCKKLKRYAKAAKIEKRITVHSFRHTLATAMLERGAELRHIQAILGHEHLKTTERYTHIAKAELKRVQAKHHPREAIELPEGAIRYRGLDQ